VSPSGARPFHNPLRGRGRAMLRPPETATTTGNPYEAARKALSASGIAQPQASRSTLFEKRARWRVRSQSGAAACSPHQSGPRLLSLQLPSDEGRTGGSLSTRETPPSGQGLRRRQDVSPDVEHSGRASTMTSATPPTGAPSDPVAGKTPTPPRRAPCDPPHNDDMATHRRTSVAPPQRSTRQPRR
jgi:hypothetical protein